MSMIAFMGTRTSRRKVCPSGLANACTVTSRGMSCADTRAMPVTKTMRERAARRTALERCTALLRRVRSRPDRALVRFRHGAHPLVEEPLQTFSFPGLRRVDVPLRIGRDAVHAVELAGLPPAVAEAGQLLQRLPIDDADDVVHAVGHVDVLLLRVLRERDVPYRARALRVLREEAFLHELALGREHLQAIADAVADVDEPIDGDIRAVHGVVELLRRLGRG